MRLHTFFINTKIEPGSPYSISDKAVIQQISSVLRLTPGSKIVLLDNDGCKHTCRILEIDKNTINVEVQESDKDTTQPKREVHLFMSLIKKDKFEWVVEKCTELGVSHIIPLISTRTEKKNFNGDRCVKIMIEASEQSGRYRLPRLYEIYDWKKVFDWDGVQYVAFHPEGKDFSLAEFAPHKKIGLLIGPEGGWTADEIEVFRSHNIPICSLGTQILKAETAAIAVSSLLLLNS